MPTISTTKRVPVSGMTPAMSGAPSVARWRRHDVEAWFLHGSGRVLRLRSHKRHERAKVAAVRRAQRLEVRRSQRACPGEIGRSPGERVDTRGVQQRVGSESAPSSAAVGKWMHEHDGVIKSRRDLIGSVDIGARSPVRRVFRLTRSLTASSVRLLARPSPL